MHLKINGRVCLGLADVKRCFVAFDISALEILLITKELHILGAET